MVLRSKAPHEPGAPLYSDEFSRGRTYRTRRPRGTHGGVHVGRAAAGYCGDRLVGGGVQGRETLALPLPALYEGAPGTAITAPDIAPEDLDYPFLSDTRDDG